MADNIGLIPAGAGNIWIKEAISSYARAHPRGCGEHSKPTVLRRLRRGSSPRVRGTYGHGDNPAHPAGLIPAGAGNIWIA